MKMINPKDNTVSSVLNIIQEGLSGINLFPNHNPSGSDITVEPIDSPQINSEHDKLIDNSKSEGKYRVITDNTESNDKPTDYTRISKNTRSDRYNTLDKLFDDSSDDLIDIDSLDKNNEEYSRSQVLSRTDTDSHISDDLSISSDEDIPLGARISDDSFDETMDRNTEDIPIDTRQNKQYTSYRTKLLGNTSQSTRLTPSDKQSSKSGKRS